MPAPGRSAFMPRLPNRRRRRWPSAGCDGAGGIGPVASETVDCRLDDLTAAAAPPSPSIDPDQDPAVILYTSGTATQRCRTHPDSAVTSCPGASSAWMRCRRTPLERSSSVSCAARASMSAGSGCYNGRRDDTRVLTLDDNWMLNDLLGYFIISTQGDNMNLRKKKH